MCLLLHKINGLSIYSMYYPQRILAIYYIHCYLTVCKLTSFTKTSIVFDTQPCKRKSHAHSPNAVPRFGALIPVSELVGWPSDRGRFSTAAPHVMLLWMGSNYIFYNSYGYWQNGGPDINIDVEAVSLCYSVLHVWPWFYLDRVR